MEGHMKIFWVLGLVMTKSCGQDTHGRGLIQTKKPMQHLFDFQSVTKLSKGLSMEDSILIKFVLDYVSKSNWESVVFFFSNSSDLLKAFSPFILQYFNVEGKFVSIHTTSHHLFPDSLSHNRHTLGVVCFCDSVEEDFFNKASENDLFDAYRSWLIIKPENSKIEEILSGLNLGLSSNMVVATIEKRGLTTTITTTTPSVKMTTGLLIGYRKREIEEQSLNRFQRNVADALSVHLVQIFKASKSENETLTEDLGFWDIPNGMLKTKEPIIPELRWDLGGFKISVGIRNSSLEIRGDMALDKFSLDSAADEESHFMELFDCIRSKMNASFEIVQFQKLGWRNEEGGWTHLLGGVVDSSVDFALETIDQNVDKTQDMSFTYAIIITMNNIYFRRPKSGGLRDIFLAPFSPRLLVCVLSTSFLLAIAMISITIFNYHTVESKKTRSDFQILTRGKKERSVVFTTSEARKWEISEAALWSVSVLCMQGSQWSPKSVSGSLLLINSLLFALIIYNSFAAFITSVLSVKDVKIKELKDLAGSEFAFGYTLGNSDELFLRTVNDTLLRELYFKGLRENDGVSDPIAGMHRASKGGYAFFVGARIARRALQMVVAHKRRCELQELYLPITKSYASIPVTKKSSLKKILDYKIIRLMEAGLLHRFQKLILPSMPSCVELSAFNSARLTDVYSAFFVLAVGWMASLLIFTAEILWHKRKNNTSKLVVKNTFNYNGFKSDSGLFWLR